MSSSQASTSASVLTVSSDTQQQQQQQYLAAPSLAHLYGNRSSPRGMYARSRKSSIGIDVVAAAGAVTRSRACSVGGRDSPQTPSPPPYELQALDRGPGTPDFTVDRFVDIRGPRDHRHGTSRTTSSLANSSRTGAKDDRAQQPSQSEGGAMWSSSLPSILSGFRSAVLEARMPPLRPHLPALLFLMTVFVGSTLCVLLALSTLPLQLPSHITDLTLTEIRDMSMSLRTYSRSSNRAFAHTLAVLGAFFTWKQSFTVPGSLIMNVVFGAMYGPFWGTVFTSLLTAVGGMFCYLLMAPLGPLISAMPGFGKGLQKMRKALQGGAGYTPTSTANAKHPTLGLSSGIRSSLAAPTPSHRALRLPSNLSGSPVRRFSKLQKKGRKASAQSNLWSYLLVLRLLPIVPYGLMNIACAVLHVPLLPYTVTLALGSIPWNACTVQIGDLLLEVVFALPVSSSSADVAAQIGSGGFTTAPAPGQSSLQPSANVHAAAQSGLQAITEKIWNRDMLLRLTLMSIVSLAPMVLQYVLKRRQERADALADAAICEEEQESLFYDADEGDLVDEDDDDDDASLAEKGSNKSQSDEQEAGSDDDADDRRHHSSLLANLFDMRAWRSSWQPEQRTSDLPISLQDFRTHTKRYSSPASIFNVGDYRKPSIKRAIAHAVV